MEGKTCIVTGASSGIGRVTARELARMGARTVLVCRDRERGEAAAEEMRRATGNDAVELLIADFASLDAVRALAAEFLASHDALHVLVNNAGLIMTERRTTAEGFEVTMCVNHLAPFLLTNLLLDTMRASAPARIVNVASEGHRFVRGIDLNDLHAERRRYRGFQTYARTKLANILFTVELARRLAGSGVTANCLHPGIFASGFGRETHGLFRFIMTVGRPFLPAPERGARTSIYLASSPAVDGLSGEYFIRCRVRRASAAARNEETARRLWDLSARLTGIAAR